VPLLTGAEAGIPSILNSYSLDSQHAAARL